MSLFLNLVINGDVKGKLNVLKTTPLKNIINKIQTQYNIKISKINDTSITKLGRSYGLEKPFETFYDVMFKQVDRDDVHKFEITSAPSETSASPTAATSSETPSETSASSTAATSSETPSETSASPHAANFLTSLYNRFVKRNDKTDEETTQEDEDTTQDDDKIEVSKTPSEPIPNKRRSKPIRPVTSSKPTSIPTTSIPTTSKPRIKVIWGLHGEQDDYVSKKEYYFPYHSVKFYCPNANKLKSNLDLQSINEEMNNDNRKLILEKIPKKREEEKMALRPMSFFPVEPTNNFYNVVGAWICDPGKECRDDNHYIHCSQLNNDLISRGRTNFRWEDIFVYTRDIIKSNKKLPQDLSRYELCMNVCRSVSGEDPKFHVEEGRDKYIVSKTGGDNDTLINTEEIQLVSDKIVEQIKDIQKNELETKDSINVSEDQLGVYLKEPYVSMDKVIDSLSTEEISKQLIEHPQILEKEINKIEEENWKKMLEDPLDSVNNQQCPSYDKIPKKCDENGDSEYTFKKQALIYHPDKNISCPKSSDNKFKYLKFLCEKQNNITQGGKKSKTSKRCKKSKKSKKSKKAKKCKLRQKTKKLIKYK